MLKKAMKTMNFDEIIGVVDQFGGDVGVCKATENSTRHGSEQ
jgi:hypothetical protein